MRRCVLVVVAALAAGLGPVRAQPWAPDPLEPVSSGGLAAVDRALARLSVHARLLVVGAHPDDEDNALLTWVARGLGGEAAYLSLSRGEGGQNLIGDEMGVELGVLRTGELLAARRLEGSRQYFARAYDFGYTRSLEETFARWPRELLQEDAVRIVRRFKPQVIVAVFPADERAGHGQHQASAVIAADVFELSGEGNAFASLPDGRWQPAALYHRAWLRFGEEPSHGYSLAGLDPISGRSLGQLAAASRSFHRSQDMGREQLAGPDRGGLVWITGAGGEGGDPFAGVDTRLASIVDPLPVGPSRDEASEILERAEEIARGARRKLTPAAVEAAVPALAEILDLLRQAEQLLEADGPEARAARALVAEKASVASYGLAAAAGVVIEATADRAAVVSGGSLEIEASVWPAGETEAAVDEVEVLIPPGWRIEILDTKATGDGVDRRRFRVEASGGPFAASPLYYLRKEPRHDAWVGDLSGPSEPVGGRSASAHHDLQGFLRGDLYDPTHELPPEVLGEPLGPPLVTLRFELEIAGRPVVLEREAVHRFADQAFGERRVPVRMLAPLEVSLEPEVVLVPSLTGAADLTVTVRSNLEERIEGTLGLGGDGPKTAFALTGEGDVETARLSFESLPGAARQLAIGEARTADGIRVTGSQRLVSYSHIRPVPVPVRSTGLVSRFELALPPLGRVGYVRGASDRVPEILAAVGVPIELLDADDLDRGELSGFDAIVVGSRAYEIDAALRRDNDRLLEYARRGGLLVVQYQQYQFVRGGFAPFPLEISRPHGRVTDETAPVEALAPDHPVFHRPNELTAADWLGWVQERGLYFAGSWDERYRPLLAIADPGREAERGALLVAAVGEGTYVYTGLSFFRQLPAGVAGAVRLFVNLLALGEA